MPRVSINKKKYKLIDLKAWIIGQAKTNNMTYEDLAKALNISKSSMQDKLRTEKTPSGKKPREDPFTYGELLDLFELFGADTETRVRLLTIRK